jgi:Tfp pilus assembly protein PilF
MRTATHEFRILLFAVTFYVMGCPAFSQQTAPARGLSISGFIRDAETNQLISSAGIELQRSSGEAASSPLVSGTRGEFEFNGVSSGDYLITVHARGYDSTTASVMLGGIPLANVTIVMRRSKSAEPSVPEDTVSAHQLSVPDKARDQFQKGVQQLAGTRPDYRQALSHFERAIKEYPDYYEAYAQVGIAQHHLGDKAAAERALRKSAALSSGRYLDALSLLAEMLNDDQRFSESEPFARSCATQDETAWGCSLELARALSGMKHPNEAEAVALKANELNPNHPATLLVLGNIHIQQHRYAEVVKDFDAYLKLNPTGPESDQVRAAQAQARQALARMGHSTPVEPQKP